MKSEMISTAVKTTGKAAAVILLGLTLTGCGTKDEALGLHQTGTVAFMLNCDQAASTYFEKAIETNPEYGPSYIMLGDCYLREGKPEKAIKAIEKGLQYTLDNGHMRLAQRKLARSYREIGMHGKAHAHIVEYTKMSVVQGKFDHTKRTETKEFLASLELPDGEKVDLETVVAESMKKRKKVLAKNENNSGDQTASETEDSKDVTGFIASLLGFD